MVWYLSSLFCSYSSRDSRHTITKRYYIPLVLIGYNRRARVGKRKCILSFAAGLDAYCVTQLLYKPAAIAVSVCFADIITPLFFSFSPDLAVVQLVSAASRRDPVRHGSAATGAALRHYSYIRPQLPNAQT